ncbi:NADPH-dependent FMN reductase [Olivibacter sp. CPCC 100613]|uniref:NADPH-dependent FMN reductase n=1 Tax=Olivibacter sp. CPCC 100613 TaxID=3079931 RepID=UPI002FF48D14
MNIVLFNGALEKRNAGTSKTLSNYFNTQLSNAGASVTEFDLADAGIPFFDLSLANIPQSVKIMTSIFTQADAHIWLTPLYHGGMTGIMKNCLDWLEISSKSKPPYLTNKTVGLVCWASGGHAMQGINAMDAVAKSLRAWTLPYTIPVVRNDLFDTAGNLEPLYKEKFNLMSRLLLESPHGVSAHV